jgi:hypothetical protein
MASQAEETAGTGGESMVCVITHMDGLKGQTLRYSAPFKRCLDLMVNQELEDPSHCTVDSFLLLMCVPFSPQQSSATG